MFHTGFVYSLASGSQQTHYTLQCSGIQMIPVKTQSTTLHSLNSFCLKTMYNVALVDYLTVSVVVRFWQLPKCELHAVHQGFQAENFICCCSSSIWFLNSCPTNLVTCPKATRSLIQMPLVILTCHPI